MKNKYLTAIANIVVARKTDMWTKMKTEMVWKIFNGHIGNKFFYNFSWEFSFEYFPIWIGHKCV